jgi:hypothetical protein
VADTLHPAATQHLPSFITPPGQTDVLMTVTIVLLITIVLVIGNLYLRLHALPERMAHRANLVQFEIVAVLALLALFTHNHIFWVAALLLALIRVPDFSTPIASIAESLDKLAAGSTRAIKAPTELIVPAEPSPGPSLEAEAVLLPETKPEPVVAHISDAKPGAQQDPKAELELKQAAKTERRPGASRKTG